MGRPVRAAGRIVVICKLRAALAYNLWGRFFAAKAAAQRSTPYRKRNAAGTVQRKDGTHMANLGNNVKLAFLKGLEAIGNGASNMASNAHHRLNEINLETRRRELMSELPVRALDLWQNGAELPEPLNAMLRELSELDEQLTVLRAQRYARVEVEKDSQDEGEGAGEEGAEKQPSELPEGAVVEEEAADGQEAPQSAEPDGEAQEAAEPACAEAPVEDESGESAPIL